MWRQLLVAVAISSSAVVHVLAIDGCADGLYPVSVLDVAEVQCLTSTPCSGTYSSAGLPQGVGACPTGTGCALLPNSFIMGCVAEGRADITYVNADGTLTKSGKVVTVDTTTTTMTSTTPAVTTTGSVAPTTTGSTSTTGSSATTGSTATTGSAATTTTAITKATAPTDGSSTTSKSEGDSTQSTTEEDGNATATAAVESSSSSDTAITPTPSNNTTSDSNSSSDSDSGSDWSSESDSFSTSTDSSVIESGSEEANQQNSWKEADIASDGTSSISDGSSSPGIGIGTIVAIVVGCLAVVAIVAGARLLKKGKEGTELTTPEGNFDNYGGGMTPKENVLLL